MMRFAQKEDLPRVNDLRRQVNDVHVAGQPDIFRPGFPPELRDYIDTIWRDESKRIVVAERDGALCGYAVLQRVDRPETPFMCGRSFLEVRNSASMKSGAGRASPWSSSASSGKRPRGRAFTESSWTCGNSTRALAFYEAAGFKTYRRYMEMKC